MKNEDTICAISTAPGNGAIAVIRLSGEKSIEICDSIFTSVKLGKTLINQNANTIHFGKIEYQNEVIDEVLVSLFKAPNSYTGENSIEISCHGSTYIQQKIVSVLIHQGARMAQPGEFTLRSFLNGKMDLSQAEAVADLIASQSKASHNIAMSQMRGGYSGKLVELRNQLLQFISLIELELDFSEEDVEFADRKQLESLVLNLKSTLSKLITSFELGNVIKNGIQVAIVGNPNVGKSTLLNAFLEEDRAIVSDIAGTTRDTIEDTINIDGVLFRFIDTAGLRQTTDTIEKLGINRTKEKIEKANVVLLMVDACDDVVNINNQIDMVKVTGDQALYLLFNKIDLLSENQKNKVFSVFEQRKNTFYLSAKLETGIEEIKLSLSKTFQIKNLNEDIIISNSRHYESLVNTKLAIERVNNGLRKSISSDFLAQDIREALHYLGEITGEITTDEILGNIFKNFCIGK